MGDLVFLLMFSFHGIQSDDVDEYVDDSDDDDDDDDI